MMRHSLLTVLLGPGCHHILGGYTTGKPGGRHRLYEPSVESGD